MPRPGLARLQAAVPSLIEAACRLGYAARGAVYLSMGVLALLAALDRLPRASGAGEAIEAWARWPIGLALIAAVGLGLVFFAVWRGLQSVCDADGHGTTPKAWAVRAGQLLSGLVYGALALSAFELLDGLEDVREADETGEMRAAAARVLALPGGDRLLLAAGLVVLAFGIGNLIQGALQDFGKRLRCAPAVCARVVPLARLGYAARGLAVLPLGYFLCQAGLAARASPARSWADALQALEAQPFGSTLLVAIALGLTAFGLFGLVEAWLRVIKPAEAISA